MLMSSKSTILPLQDAHKIHATFDSCLLQVSAVLRFENLAAPVKNVTSVLTGVDHPDHERQTFKILSDFD